MINNLLFICTGNYYRSRFAEILFNYHARELNLDWQAQSRGLAAHLLNESFGRISPYALNGLLDRGIRLEREHRWPLQLQQRDLEEATLVIAVKESEHRPLLEVQFPDWVDRVEYWNIHDLDVMPATQALQALECEVQILVQRLVRR